MSKDLTAEELIEFFKMEPHPEGGYYKRTYQSEGMIQHSALPPSFKGDRHFSTAIHFLLPAGTQSFLHRIASDEMWHFYLGGPMTLIQLDPRGEMKKILLGQDIRAGHQLQYCVPSGCWFGGYPCPESSYSLVGCTVAPGFDFSDFEMGQRDPLLKSFPQARHEIEKLTRPL